MSDPAPNQSQAKSAGKLAPAPAKGQRPAPHFLPQADTGKSSRPPMPLPKAEDSAAKDSPRSDAVIRKEHELLIEASLVAEHLHRHFVELDQRESQIAGQRQLLEEQRQQIQQAAAQLE